MVAVDRLRIRIDLAYDGTQFSGWAAQPGQRTVEGVLGEAMTTILRSPAPVRLTVAGRTDAGVHARGQVAHADIDPDAWRGLPGRSARTPEAAAVARLNALLPDDVLVGRVAKAVPGFDARFGALSRRYLYRIADEAARRDPLRRFDTVPLRGTLEVARLNEAAASLLGLHDFAAFCKSREGATTTRNLASFEWERLPDGVVAGTLVADAFCHSMVRALVGAVVPVALGKYEAGFANRVLQARVRDPRVKVMPAHGLSLEEVIYPADAQLSARVTQARARRDADAR